MKHIQKTRPHNVALANIDTVITGRPNSRQLRKLKLMVKKELYQLK